MYGWRMACWKQDETYSHAQPVFQGWFKMCSFKNLNTLCMPFMHMDPFTVFLNDIPGVYRQRLNGDMTQLWGGAKTHGNLKVKMGVWRLIAHMGRKIHSVIYWEKEDRWTWWAECRINRKVMGGIRISVKGTFVWYFCYDMLTVFEEHFTWLISPV